MDRQKDRLSFRHMDMANEQEKISIVITIRDTAKHSIALRTYNFFQTISVSQ